MYSAPTLQKLARIALWAFLALLCGFPYIVDVVYPWDLTPSHFAQERIGDGEECGPSDVKSHVATPDIPGNMLVPSRMAWEAIPSWAVHDDRFVVPTPALLLSVLTISRPPPAL